MDAADSVRKNKGLIVNTLQVCQTFTWTLKSLSALFNQKMWKILFCDMAKCPPSLTFRYNRGRLQTDPEHRYMATLVENSAQEGTGVTEEKGDDETPKDWELEELLAWTNTLNFEE